MAPTSDADTTAVYRKNYLQPFFWIKDVNLDVQIEVPEGSAATELEDKVTRVTCEMKMDLNPARSGGENGGFPKVALTGDKNLTLEKVEICRGDAAGPEWKELVKDTDYTVAAVSEADNELSVQVGSPPAKRAANGATPSFWLRTTCTMQPVKNKSGSGLYAGYVQSEGGKKVLYSTQMEAEGMRRFTYFADRPDVMSTYRSVRIEAPKEQYPVLLSNGNEMRAGEVANSNGSRHWAEYSDPWPKPCYLFALVAGDLVHVQDTFKTRGGRDVLCRVFAEKGTEQEKLTWALASLQKAMKFDEDFFNLEYDLDIFNIVSVRDFNMGAMENKSLNIFNEKLILASPNTATDADYNRIEGVVAHEYFHNWTGNRVTCQDWFQLTLKEGLTVYRDQTFSRQVGLFGESERLDQVRILRNSQFPEDAGPLAHPIRPDSYEKIDNFYTPTVYEKGSEVIRMYETILGMDGFKRGLSRYIKENDGRAATCDDFLRAMSEANDNADLKLFSQWYCTKGTPTVDVTVRAEGDASVIRLAQGGAASAVKEILHIPIRYGVLDAETGEEVVPSSVHHLKSETADIALPASLKGRRLVLSLNRGFGAPILLNCQQSVKDLGVLAVHDTDPFCRYEAFQELVKIVIHDVYESTGGDPASSAATPVLCDTVGKLVEQLKPSSDPGVHHVLAQTLGLPGMEDVAAKLKLSCQTRGEEFLMDPIRLAGAREAVRKLLVERCGEVLVDAYQAIGQKMTLDKLHPQMIGYRRSRNAIQAILENAKFAHELNSSCQTMTERAASFQVITRCAESDQAQFAQAKEAFYQFGKAEGETVLGMWFQIQAMCTTKMDVIHELAAHPDFDLTNANRFRSLVLAFIANPKLFWTEEGIAFVAGKILALDKAGNGQVAARAASNAFQKTKRVTEEYRKPMEAAVTGMLNADHTISAELREILSKIVK